MYWPEQRHANVAKIWAYHPISNQAFVGPRSRSKFRRTAQIAIQGVSNEVKSVIDDFFDFHSGSETANYSRASVTGLARPIPLCQRDRRQRLHFGCQLGSAIEVFADFRQIMR